MGHLNLIPAPWRPQSVNATMGNETMAWCNYHQIRGHHTNDCHQLKWEIEALIQRGHLLTYVKDVVAPSTKR